MSRNSFAVPEMSDLHLSKILLCYLMNKLNRSVGEEQLYEIAMESGVIDHFLYSEALDELLKAGSLSRTADGEINIEEKGRLGAEYLDMSVPLPFRKKILEAAYLYFSEIRRRNECVCEIVPAENGSIVKFSIGDSTLTLMKAELYAPDSEQAGLIAERLKRNPTKFYRSVTEAILNNPEDKPDIAL